MVREPVVKLLKERVWNQDAKPQKPVIGEVEQIQKDRYHHRLRHQHQAEVVSIGARIVLITGGRSGR